MLKICHFFVYPKQHYPRICHKFGACLQSFVIFRVMSASHIKCPYCGPRFRGNVWRDWVVIDWGEEGRLPNKIYGFLDLTSANIPHNHGIEHAGTDIEAAVHAIVENGSGQCPIGDFCSYHKGSRRPHKQPWSTRNVRKRWNTYARGSGLDREVH